MADVVIAASDFVTAHISAERYILYELSDHFSFFADNYFHDPRFKNKVWDGKIRIFKLSTQTIYRGLVQEVIDFCKERGFSVDNRVDLTQSSFSEIEARRFIESMGLPEHIDVRPYQFDAFVDAVRLKRVTLESATSSGKSLMIYLIARFFNLKTLIVVPDTGLVKQLSSDFTSYGYDKPVQQIYQGQTKEIEQTVTVAIWNSIWKQPAEWFDQFDVVFFDEAHKCKAKCLTDICSKLTNCQMRYGLTGSMGSSKTNQKIITGLIGPIKKVITARELIDEDFASRLTIRCIELNYSNKDKVAARNKTYTDEIDFIIDSEARNKFVTNLLMSLKGNTMVLYHKRRHGVTTIAEILKQDPNKLIFYIDQHVKADQREQIRMDVDQPDQTSLLFATYKLCSTGINIRNLNNIVLLGPIKADITLIQSIGRVLRQTDAKTTAEMIDLCDNLTMTKKANYCLKHFHERIKIYNIQKHRYKLYNVQI